MRLLLLLLLLLAVALLLGSQHVEGSRSVESAYDSNKGVFSPQGRLVQLDYVEVRVESEAAQAQSGGNITSTAVQLH